MANRKIAFIVNPISGGKSKQKMMEEIQSVPWLANDNIELHLTTRSGDAYEQAKKYAAMQYDIVVAVGGDGTVNEVAHGLVFSQTVLAIIPVGSGNGLARELKIPMNAYQSAKLLENGIISEIDTCTLNSHPFFCTAGVGYDASVGKTFADSGKRGFLSYLKAGLKTYTKMKPTTYQLTIDDKEKFEVTAFDITFANARQFGNNAYIAPLADLRDGFIDLVVIKPFPWYCCIGVGSRLFRNNMDKSKYVQTYKCKKAVLERPKEDCVHFDGEPYIGGKHIEVGIKPLALKVLIAKNKK